MLNSPPVYSWKYSSQKVWDTKLEQMIQFIENFAKSYGLLALSLVKCLMN